MFGWFKKKEQHVYSPKKVKILSKDELTKVLLKDIEESPYDIKESNWLSDVCYNYRLPIKNNSYYIEADFIFKVDAVESKIYLTKSDQEFHNRTEITYQVNNTLIRETLISRYHWEQRNKYRPETIEFISDYLEVGNG